MNRRVAIIHEDKLGWWQVSDNGEDDADNPVYASRREAIGGLRARLYYKMGSDPYTHYVQLGGRVVPLRGDGK